MAMPALWAQSAAANLRVPITRHAPSGALSGPGQGLTVVSESLQIQCGSDCVIRAVYRVRAREPKKYKFEFILPESCRVVVKIENSSPRVQTSPFSVPTKAKPGEKPRFITSVAMARATFVATLQEGVNDIAISYRQPWGKDERKFEGYFSGWKSARILRYELWPLKEWQLVTDFTMKIGVTIAPAMAANQEVLLMAYPTRESEPNILKQVPSERDKDGIFIDLNLGHEFPDRLEIILGPKDILTGNQP